MKNNEKVVKVTKKIDIEGLVYKATLVMNLIAFITAIVNGVVMRSRYVSFFVMGWCIALMIINVIVSIAGHKNFKEEMEQLKWLMHNINEFDNNMKDMEVNEDAKKKL